MSRRPARWTRQREAPLPIGFPACEPRDDDLVLRRYTGAAPAALHSAPAPVEVATDVPARPSRAPTDPVPPGLRRYARGQGPREREPQRLGPPPAPAPPGTARHQSPGPQDRSDRPEN